MISRRLRAYSRGIAASTACSWRGLLKPVLLTRFAEISIDNGISAGTGISQQATDSVAKLVT
jgi:hypothetical protein